MKEVSITAVGDISLGGDVNNKLRDFDPFEFIRDEVVNADISIGNLECVIGDKGSPVQTYTHLRTDAKSTEFLKIFKILSLANNHILDYGIEGMNETIDVLRRNHILTVGVGSNYQQAARPLIIERKSIRIGFVNFMYDEVTMFPSLARARGYGRPGPARYFEDDILGSIQRLRKTVDLIVASIHWGVEYIHFPSPQQRLLAEKLVDKGVDIIVGHHPHVVQGIQRYKGGLIFYSLGNLVFDPAISNVKYGLMVKLHVCKKGVSNCELFPLNMNENYQPVKSIDKKAFLRHLESISKPVAFSPFSTYENFWFEYAAKNFFSSYKSNVVLVKRYGIKCLLPFFGGLMLPYSIKFHAGLLRKGIRKMIRG